MAYNSQGLMQRMIAKTVSQSVYSVSTYSDLLNLGRADPRYILPLQTVNPDQLASEEAN